jgi:hypothetical protein
VRGGVAGGKNYFCLAAAARAAPRPQAGPRALCEVGLVACVFLGSFLAFAIGPQRQVFPSARGSQREGVGEAKNYFLARSSRSSCAPRPGPRALFEMGFAACSLEFWAVSFCFPSQLRGLAGLGGALWESFSFLELGGGLAPGILEIQLVALLPL